MKKEQDEKRDLSNLGLAVLVWLGGTAVLANTLPKKLAGVSMLAPIVGAIYIGYKKPFFKDKK